MNSMLLWWRQIRGGIKKIQAKLIIVCAHKKQYFNMLKYDEKMIIQNYFQPCLLKQIKLRISTIKTLKIIISREMDRSSDLYAYIFYWSYPIDIFYNYSWLPTLSDIGDIIKIRLHQWNERSVCYKIIL
jgi:hypothetical protein